MRLVRPGVVSRFARSLRIAARVPITAARGARLAVAAILVGCVLFAVPSGPANAASDPCGPSGNAISCENSLPGTPQSVWDVAAGEGATIQGFADPFSVNLGGTENFKIESPAASYSVDIYRIGYYGGDGARLVATVTPNITASQNQPACNTNTATGLVDCSNWGVSASWTVPTNLVSGVYFAHIYRTDGTSDENQIPFVVRDDSSHSDILFATDDETWEAYNDWGGYSLYTGNGTDTLSRPTSLDAGRAEQVSYDRPFSTRFDTPYGQDYFFYAEFPEIEFLEENGYNVSYIDQGTVGSAQGASLIEQHKALVKAGHDEYWTASEVANVTAARNAGVNMAFFTGNEVYWKTRLAPDAAGEAGRTLITYKESLDSAITDPNGPSTWTGAWWDPRFSPPGDGGQPENALTGQLWTVNAGTGAITVPSQYASLQFWRNTAVASLQPGQSVTLAPETLGYEWDQDVDNGYRPAGEIDMSSTTMTAPQVVTDYQEDLAPETVTHHLTLYRAASGALVFGAGTVQWAWGLNSNHDGDSKNPPDQNMQQATVNLLADMGNAQPTTLMSNLVQATESTDTTPPTSTITSPSSGASLANGSSVTVSGTATDSGGGVVAGVEVSTDGGTSWHPASTMSPAATTVNWTYTWSATGSGTVTIESRATDDSSNIETPSDATSVTVNCPCGLYGQNYTPSVTAAGDASADELGVKFTSSVSGWVAGVRFYKGAGNNGTHTGTLWSSAGTQLATGTFTNETASGWQTLLFADPVAISANTVYVVSYFDPYGHYADDAAQFYPGPTGSTDLQPLDSTPLSAVQATGVPGGNGVYNAGGHGFPASSYNATGYGVDVVFDTTQPAGAPPAINGVTPVPGSSSNPVTTTPTVTFSKPVVPSTLSMTVTDSAGPVTGTVSMNSTDTIATFTPASQFPAGTNFTVSVSGEQDQWGQTGASDTYTFISAKATPPSGQCPCSVWPDTSIPATPDSGDTAAVTLGVKFSASAAGYISGVRFYKAPANTGAHSGYLWSSTGTVLATGTFTNESTTGWEELDFSSPVQITAGTTYVAGYSDPNGHYSFQSGGLTSAVTNAPLTVPASGGVFAYGASGVFPTSTYKSSNYWVDVVYQPIPNTNPPMVSAAYPSGGATSVPVSHPVSVTFNAAIQSGSATVSLTDANGNSVTGTTTLSSSATTLTFTPGSALTAGMTYTVSVSGARGTNGATMTSPDTYQFVTSGASACPCTLFESDAVPVASSANDSNAVTLGVQFTPDANGWISGVRFYKGAGNTGTHIGDLWTSTGTLLASATFTGESSSGWQTVEFQNPVAVTAGTTYVAGYYAPVGHYADDASTFTSAMSNSPLHAPASTAATGNGLYLYGNNKFPTKTVNAANYWVDPIFWSAQPPDLASPVVTSTNPISGQTSVPVTTPISFTFGKAVQPSTISVSVTTTSGGVAVAGSTSYNATTNTATFTPSSSLANATSYTVSVSGAQDTTGLPMLSAYTWTFTTAQPTPAPGVCPCSLWPDSTLPSTPSASDSNSVEVGVVFTPSQNGRITGIRFYKGSGNTGTHVGSLWTSSGTLLESVTFTGESAAGWQQANFATPVSVTAGTTYVASYLAPVGGYAMTASGLSSAVTNGPLTAVAYGTNGGNGAYLYTSSVAFPRNAFNANYWVDVAFTPSS
jgi:methionine-rich copper-binding protein CopC